MRTSSLTALFLTGVILAAAGSAAAAGLGKLTVLSSLGERLAAEVDLVSVTPAEADSLTARVAPPEAYAHSNVPYSMTLSDLHVKIEKRANGRSYLRITSTHPYNEPYLDVLLQLNWSGGQIVREYTALVDPAGYHEPPAAAATAPPRSGTRAAVAPAPAAAPAAHVRPAPAVATRRPDTYPVKHGDTLYGIAEATMPNEVTVDQMLIGLYRANPNAFHGNINRMTAGKILRIPSTDQIEQVAPSKARHEVRLQIKNWHTYRNRIAAAASRKAVAAPEAGGTVSGKIATKVEEAHPAGVAAPKDVLKVSEGEAAGTAAAGKGESSAARLQALEEEASARQKQLDDANSRIAQLEKTIVDMRKLIEIKSAGMATAQQQAGQAASAQPAQGQGQGATEKAGTATQSTPGANEAGPQSTPATAVAGSGPSAATPAPAAAPASTEAAASAATPGSTAASNSTTPSNSAANSTPPAATPATTTTPATATTPTAPSAAAASTHTAASAGAAHAGEPAEQQTTDQKAAAKPMAATTPQPAKARPAATPQPGFIQSLTENPLYIGVAVIIILLLIYLWMRRRRGAADDDEPDFHAGPVLAGGAAAATTAAAFAAVKEAPAMASPDPTPEPQPAARTDAISDEVDPLAEAEVYIAYGRDAQAEEILKDALVHHPERADVQVKLLEVYAARNDKAAFEGLAQKLHQSTGGSGEEWLKVAALGYTLDPANPLFEAGKVAPSPAPLTGTPGGLDFELDTPVAHTTTDIQFDPVHGEESVSRTGRLTAQFAAAGLEMTAPHNRAAPDFALPGSMPGPEDTQRIADGEEAGALEAAPIPDFTLDSDTKAPTDLRLDLPGDSGQAPGPAVDAASATGQSAGNERVLNLEDSQLLLDEALKAARSEPLMPDFRLDLPAEHAAGTTDIGLGTDGGHASASDLALDIEKNDGHPIDLALDSRAGGSVPGNGAAPAFDLSGINLEFDDKPESSVAAPASGTRDDHWHDVQTKFDLAKAYQEMGDRDGAKEILREVVEEGDAEQKTQAKTLLQNLD